MLSFALYLKHIGNRAAFLKHFRNRVAFLNQFWSILEAFLKRKCLVFPVVRIRVAVQNIEKCAVKQSWLSSNGKQQVQFEREFVYSFVIEFNPKGDIMLFCCLWGCSSSRKKTIQSPTVAESCNSRVDLTIPSWQGKTFSIYLRDKRQFHLPSLCAVQYS